MVTGSGVRHRLVPVRTATPELAARLTSSCRPPRRSAALSVLARDAFRSRARRGPGAGRVPDLRELPQARHRRAAREDRDGPLPRDRPPPAASPAAGSRRGCLTALATLTWQPVVCSPPWPRRSSRSSSRGSRGCARSRRTSRAARSRRPVTALLSSPRAPAAGVLGIHPGEHRLHHGSRRSSRSWPPLTDGLPLASLVLVVAGWDARRGLGGGRPPPRDAGTGATAVDRHLLVLGTGGLVAGLWSCLAINGGADLSSSSRSRPLGLAAALQVTGARLACRSRPRAGWPRSWWSVAVARRPRSPSAPATHRLPLERRDYDRMSGPLPTGIDRALDQRPARCWCCPIAGTPYPWQLVHLGASYRFLDDHLDGGLAGYADRIARLHPGLIAVGRAPSGRLGRSRSWTATIRPRRGRGPLAWYASGRPPDPATLRPPCGS